MRILIASNFTIGFFFFITFSLPDRFQSFLCVELLGVLLMFSFLALFIINVGFVFKVWKQRRFFSLIPIGTYVSAFMLFAGLARAEANFTLKGTPCRPDSFFDEAKRTEFTQIAMRVLKARQDNILRPDDYANMGKYDLKLLDVKTNEHIVVFGCYRGHAWFEYIFSEIGSANVYNADEHPIQKNLGDGWYFRNW